MEKFKVTIGVIELCFIPSLKIIA